MHVKITPVTTETLYNRNLSYLEKISIEVKERVNNTRSVTA